MLDDKKRSRKPKKAKNATIFRPDIPIPVPLVQAISTNKAVVFVGAGASIPVGLPKWATFINDCLALAKASAGESNDKWQFTESLILQGDLLTAAELLHQGLGNELEHEFWRVFGSAKEPSSIHHAIARIPFSLAISTNFDLLLEAAYPSPVYPSPAVVHTWRDPDAFFSAIKNQRFAVVKTHGVVGNGPSLVLTRTQYRHLVNRNDLFNSCMRMLLSLRTFLFVGASLRDQDLLKLMDEAWLMYGPEFGPHYAILFDDEVDDHFVDFLKHSYSITVFVCKRPSDLAKWTDDARAEQSAMLLRSIAGKAALHRQPLLPSPSLDDPSFNRAAACDRLLQTAIELTGSFRGEICLVNNETLRYLERVAVWPRSARALPGARGSIEPLPEITPDSIIGNLFIKAKPSDDFVYLPDVSSFQAEAALQTQGFADATFVRVHPDVQSELACPICSDGKRVGVINVESDVPDAYTLDHAKVLRRVADQVGWVYLEANQRKDCSRGLRHYFEHPNDFGRLIRMSRYLNHIHLRFILWEIDYVNGQLLARSETTPSLHRSEADTIQPFTFRFEEHSLATLALRTKETISIDDAQIELERPTCRLAKRGCDAFGIRGPLVAIPVYSQGHTSAILVAWSETNQLQGADPSERAATNYQDVAKERIHRMAQLIANDGTFEPNAQSRAVEFLRYINDGCMPFDQGESWTRKQLWDDQCRQGITDVLLRALLQPCCQIDRVRLWGVTLDQKVPFRCIRSITRADTGTYPGKNPENAYVGFSATRDDPYVRYTLARFRNDPYARHQHQSMFGVEDKNYKDLDKDPNGSWIVAPIVRLRHGEPMLRGFLSADTHRPHRLSDGKIVMREEKPAPAKPSEPPLEAFQGYAADLVTDLLSYVCPYYPWDATSPV